MRIAHDDDEPIDLNLVPLIDCLCFLIFFFLAAATLREAERELPVDLPTADAAVAPADAEAPPLVLTVDAAGRTGIDGQAVTTEALLARLREAAAQAPPPRIRIDIDRSAPAQDLVRVVDLCRFEGLTRIAFHASDQPASR